MGRASVRAAITAYFSPQNVAGLSTIHRSRPKLITAQDFNLSLTGSGAVIVVHLVDDDEHQLVMVGTSPSGKQNTHHVALEVLFQSNLADAEAAMDDHDSLIDNIMVQFRADRRFGTGGNPVWEAGGDPEGIRWEPTEPVLGKQNTIVNGILRFAVIEFPPR